ncbi:class E sortase [Streptomyces sp. NBC_00250]|uniref:sortase n=1 Tax=Streptomyces sp. NBC_00250 TaxID=2903641 RepID=UPI002E2C39D4|nr:class E sortase [Streptomyces sp. NBC_00250]
MTTAPPPTAPRAGLALAGAALSVLAALLIGFAANLTVVGHLQHAREQSTAYDELREQLALGTAPVGQLTYDGKPLEPGAPVALLRIPALGLREVVAEGTTSEVLMSGPGHRRDTALPGQAGASVIMGRKWGYGSPFNDVHRLPNGARVEVATGQGEAVYEVTGVRHPGDPNPAALASGEGRLTLMTASGGAYTPEDIVRIDARLLGAARPSPPRPLRPGWITAAEKPLAGDPDAWPGIFLGAQALLLAALLTVLARRRWGNRQTWVTAVPVLLALGVLVSGELTRLLPNLL